MIPCTVFFFVVVVGEGNMLLDKGGQKFRRRKNTSKQISGVFFLSTKNKPVLSFVGLVETTFSANLLETSFSSSRAAMRD